MKMEAPFDGRLVYFNSTLHPRTPRMDFICTVPRPHLLGCASIFVFCVSFEVVKSARFVSLAGKASLVSISDAILFLRF